ncbi:MAG: Ni,Fe-hydrogenase III small subunit [Crocinitomicaceae bacterium]|jgi:hypothetical protein
MKKSYFTSVLRIVLFALIGILPQLSSAQTYATLPYSTGFESGALDASWTATSSQPGPNIEIVQTGTLTWTTQTAYSHTGNYFLGMDYETGGAYNLNQADLHLNTTGASNLRLRFWWAEWNDETEAQDGIYVSDDGGTSYTKILDLDGASATDLNWYEFNMSLDSVNALYGLTFTANYIVRFQQYDNFYFAGGNDGFLFDDIEVGDCLSSSSSISPSVCGTYTVPSGDETYSISGNYMDTIPSTGGCDSIISIALSILVPTSSSISDTTCGSYTSAGGMTYSSTGIYTEMYTNAAGCDSTVTLDITINTPNSSSITESSCDMYTSAGGIDYTTSGIYTEMYTNAGGCDSTVTLDITINTPSSSSITETALDSYTAPSGAVYTTSGTYMDTISNAAGCDSVITIDLTVGYTGINEYNKELISVYPNPTNGVVHIDGLGQDAVIRVYDMNGRIAMEVEKGTNVFSIAALDSGVYYLTIEYTQGFNRIQIVKQ